MWWQILISILGGLLLLWLVLLALLCAAAGSQPDTMTLRDALRLANCPLPARW